MPAYIYFGLGALMATFIPIIKSEYTKNKNKHYLYTAISIIVIIILMFTAVSFV